MSVHGSALLTTIYEICAWQTIIPISMNNARFPHQHLGYVCYAEGLLLWTNKVSST